MPNVLDIRVRRVVSNGWGNVLDLGRLVHFYVTCTYVLNVQDLSIFKKQ